MIVNSEDSGFRIQDSGFRDEEEDEKMRNEEKHLNLILGFIAT